MNELLTIPKDNFIDSYRVAEQIVSNAISSHEEYWKVIEVCERHISGQKPLSQVELDKLGMGWSWNFNYMKAGAKIEKGVAESISKIVASMGLSYVSFSRFDKDKHKDVLAVLEDGNARAVISMAIGYALVSTISKEPRVSGWMNEIETPSYSFGYCTLLFSQFDWMPTPVPPLGIAFKPRSKPNDISSWVVFDVAESSDIYSRWVDAKNGVKNGWEIEALEELMLKLFRGKLSTGRIPSSWGDVMEDTGGSYSTIVSGMDSVGLAKIFHKELNGNLTECYITRSRDGEGNESVGKILYKKDHGKFVQDHHICIVRDSGFSSTDGTIQSLRGIAKYAVEDGIRYNRCRNSIGNKMQFIGSPMFEASSSSSSRSPKITVSQGFIVLPSTHNLVEKQPAFDISSHINVLRFEEGEYSRDTQQFDPSIQGRLTSRPNKGEVQQITEEVRFTANAKSNVKFRDYAKLLETILKRIPTVKCKKSDVGYAGIHMFYETVKKMIPGYVETDEDVDKFIEEVDGFSLEPIITDVDALTVAIQMAETPFARNRFKRMLLVARGMPIEEVSIAVPQFQDRFANLGEERVATMENDMFFTTPEIVLSPTDDDKVHLEIHLSKVGRVIEGAASGALSPVDAHKFLGNALPHCIAHVEKLGRDPILHKDHEEYAQAIKGFLQENAQIAQAAQKMLQDQSVFNGPVDPKVRAEIEDKKLRTQSDIERKDSLAVTRTRQKDYQIEKNHELDLKKAELKQQVELIK